MVHVKQLTGYLVLGTKVIRSSIRSPGPCAICSLFIGWVGKETGIL